MKRLVNSIITTVETTDAPERLSLRVKAFNPEPDRPVFEQNSRWRSSCAALLIAMAMAAVASGQAVFPDPKILHDQEQLGQFPGTQFQYARGNALDASVVAGTQAWDETRISRPNVNGFDCDDRRCPGCHERAATAMKLRALDRGGSVVHISVFPTRLSFDYAQDFSRDRLKGR
jgi:hypothetical protein